MWHTEVLQCMKEYVNDCGCTYPPTMLEDVWSYFEGRGVEDGLLQDDKFVKNYVSLNDKTTKQEVVKVTGVV